MLIEEKETDISISLVTFTNIGRVVLYFAVAVLQFFILRDCFSSSVTYCDLNIVIVPAFLAVLDAVTAYMNANQSRGCRKLAYLVSFIAMYISLNTIQSNYLEFIQNGTPDVIMFNMGIIVLLLSIIELVVLVWTASRPINRSEPESIHEIRTYRK
ncbi:MAG: hypothetical protein ACTSV2_15765 [Candidatus Thorarchaeota archaeon]